MKSKTERKKEYCSLTFIACSNISEFLKCLVALKTELSFTL